MRLSTTIALTSLATIALSAGLFGIGTALAAPAGPDCLWAGGGHRPGSTVVAGGWRFTCSTDAIGTPRWNRARAGAASTVRNPNADNAQATAFSAGALQPGTDTSYYCVGSQAVTGDGKPAVFESVSDGHGSLMWREAGSISMWRAKDHAPLQQGNYGPSCPSTTNIF